MKLGVDRVEIMDTGTSMRFVPPSKILRMDNKQMLHMTMFGSVKEDIKK